MERGEGQEGGGGMGERVSEVASHMVEGFCMRRQ